MPEREIPGFTGDEDIKNDTEYINEDSQVSSEFKKMRVKEKFYSNILIGTMGFLLIAGAVGYLAKETLAREDYSGGYPSYSGQAIYTDYSGYSNTGAGNGAGASSGGCGSGGCGSSGGPAVSGSSGGGGCCGGGGGGSLAADVDLAELERQGLEKFKQEKGDSQKVTAKAGDFGCHIQIDILDENNQIIASYGYQGDSLYVIR